MQEGQDAPDFELASDSGERVSLSRFRGSPVILYFYPKDDTPGCTAQACAIRDSWESFGGTAVLGVSPDDVDSHARFKEKFKLPFTLLADTEHEVAAKFGVTREDSDYPRRSTFVIDADGTVAAVLHDADPTTHAEDVLAKLPAKD